MMPLMEYALDNEPRHRESQSGKVHGLGNEIITTGIEQLLAVTLDAPAVERLMLRNLRYRWLGIGHGEKAETAHGVMRLDHRGQ